MNSGKEIRAAVNGYGVIGKRVADAVAKQDDMHLVGVVDVASDWRTRVALDRGFALYGPGKEQVEAMRAAGLAVAGTLDSLLDDVDIVVDCTPKKVAATNVETYRKRRVQFIVEGGEKHALTGHSFVAESNYASALGRDSTRVVSCNTTSVVRTLTALKRAGLLRKARGTLLRRATDPWESHQGGIMNTLLPGVHGRQPGDRSAGNDRRDPCLDAGRARGESLDCQDRCRHGHRDVASMTKGTGTTLFAGKVAVVGAGRVGSTFAYTLAASAVAREIVLIDADGERAEGEAMDIAHAVPFFSPVTVVAGDLADVADAAVVVIAAGAAQRQGEARPALLRRNVEVLRGIVPQVVRANPGALLLVATNPVDALTYATLRLSGLPPARVLGSGTVLDTARLRAELSAHYGVDSRNVHAYVLGEHGDSELVAWSTATLANVHLPEYCRLTEMPCKLRDMSAIATRVRNAAYEIIRRKGATHFAIAAALTRIVEALVRDEASVLTVSTLVEGHYGIRDVCLSLPAVVGAAGVQRVLPVPLADDEVAGLRRSAEAVRHAIAEAGLE